MKKIALLTLLVVVFSSAEEVQFEINTVLMHYTFLFEGPTGKVTETPAGKAPDIQYGTAFLMGTPIPDEPNRVRFVLVTAAHLLTGIAGEKATIHLREKTEVGSFRPVEYPLQIRNGADPIWTVHPTADVAVMRVSLPSSIVRQMEEYPVLSTALLADDRILEEFEIHPGDELLCLGYPLRATTGFPLLRSGKIASYPLTPGKDVKVFYYDFEVFPGNSGGPVYFVDHSRRYGGNTHLGQSIQFIAGIVTMQHEKLRLAAVIPASFIIETLALLDEEP